MGGMDADGMLRLLAQNGTNGTGDDDGGTSLWYVGVLMSIFASIFSNLGVNFQKYSLNLELENHRRIAERT